MYELGLAFGLVMVIEGALYALFPDGMKRMMAVAIEQPSGLLRSAGLCLAIAGVGLVWLLKG